MYNLTAPKNYARSSKQNLFLYNTWQFLYKKLKLMIKIEKSTVVYLLNVIPGLDVAPEEADCLLGLGEALDLVGHDQRNLGDVVDSVT